MMTAPTANVAKRLGSGKLPAGAAIPRLHPQGQNKSHEPMGLQIVQHGGIEARLYFRFFLSMSDLSRASVTVTSFT